MRTEIKEIENKQNIETSIPMPIKAKPYQHQVIAYNFVSKLFGLSNGGDEKISIRNSPNSAALLMEM